MEEFFEVWTWRQLGYHDKPIGLLNSGGYYDALLAFLKATVTHAFMNDWQMDLVKVHAEPAPLLAALVEETGFTSRATDYSEI